MEPISKICSMNNKSNLLALVSCLLLLLQSCNDENIEKKITSELEGSLLTCDQKVENSAFEVCGLSKSEGQIEVWTWNLRFFPQDGTTQQSVMEIIEYYQPDIIAFQEINDRSDMLELIAAMPLYEGWVINLSGDLDLAYAYNTCTISSLADPVIVLDDIWPRPPALWSATANGFAFDVMNIHLKCCGDGVEDRLNATLKIQEYINTKEDQPVILLGDFNDEIDDEGILPFYEDAENLSYADEHVSFGSTEFYSYPSWPSDIDHILINRPLFDRLDTASTLLLDKCITSYSRSISDHRAVAAIFNF
jgi:endonuclease/exonuclease/phosphatase family metal-dependent hydrolase